jgi:hypothetical protein
MRRRSTLQISLVLIGTLAATGCSKKEERHVYTNKQDCLDDWNNDPQKCEEVDKESRHYRSNAHYYYGPWFRSGTVFRDGQGTRSYPWRDRFTRRLRQPGRISFFGRMTRYAAHRDNTPLRLAGQG